MPTVSGIVILCKLPYSALIESGLQSALNQCTRTFHSSATFLGVTLNQCTALYGSLKIATIPDTVDIQFSFLLKMSTSMLETCREI